MKFALLASAALLATATPVLAQGEDQTEISTDANVIYVLGQGLPETPATPHTPGRPRRLLNLRQGLTIRRELSNDGWKLCFSGPEARKGALMDDVMDHVERLFQQYT